MRLRHLALGLMVLSGAAPAAAQDVPDYRDDRSTPQALVESLYNAIERQEYLRAWSYFDESAVEGLERFAEGYADTAQVRVRVGEVVNEGAAGSLYASVPVTVEAVTTRGEARVYVGCYETRQIQPAAQLEPPFRPIRIIAGKLSPSGEDFDAAQGDCPEEGL